MSRIEEIKAVQELGEQIGYGHMMSLASALWRKDLKDNGYPEIGAFVPTISSFIKKGYYDAKGEKNYDEYVIEELDAD